MDVKITIIWWKTEKKIWHKCLQNRYRYEKIKFCYYRCQSTNYVSMCVQSEFDELSFIAIN